MKGYTRALEPLGRIERELGSLFTRGPAGTPLQYETGFLREIRREAAESSIPACRCADQG